MRCAVVEDDDEESAQMGGGTLTDAVIVDVSSRMGRCVVMDVDDES